MDSCYAQEEKKLFCSITYYPLESRNFVFLLNDPKGIRLKFQRTEDEA